MNKRGEKPDTLLLNDKNAEQNTPQPKKEIVDEFVDASDSEDITRFDSLRKKKKKKKKNKAANANAAPTAQPDQADQPQQMLTVSPVPQSKQPVVPAVQPNTPQQVGEKRFNIKFNNKNNQNKPFKGQKNRNGDYYQKPQPPKQG